MAYVPVPKDLTRVKTKVAYEQHRRDAFAKSWNFAGQLMPIAISFPE